jgi:hypothetical protein
LHKQLEAHAIRKNFNYKVLCVFFRVSWTAVANVQHVDFSAFSRPKSRYSKFMLVVAGFTAAMLFDRLSPGRFSGQRAGTDVVFWQHWICGYF